MAKDLIEVNSDIKQIINKAPAIKNKQRTKKSVHSEAIVKGLIQMYGKRVVSQDLQKKYLDNAPAQA